MGFINIVQIKLHKFDTIPLEIFIYIVSGLAGIKSHMLPL